MTVAERVLRRLRDEMHDRHVSQRQLAAKLTDTTQTVWNQGKVGKILTARVELKVDDAAAIADALGITLTEAVRDRGLEFYAEMTPMELRLLQRIKQRPEVLQSLLQILNISAAGKEQPAPNRPKVGRPLNSSLKRA